MSNDKKEVNVYERILKLLSAILKMVVDGVRDPNKVADVLQTIVDQGNGYLRRLYETKVIKLGDLTCAVYEIIKDGTFAQLLGSLGNDLSRLAFASREQVDEFCRIHRGKLKLQTGGYANFFLYKKGEKFFVASVSVDGIGQLYVDVDQFSFSYVWLAEYRHRLVVPQL